MTEGLTFVSIGNSGVSYATVAPVFLDAGMAVRMYGFDRAQSAIYSYISNDAGASNSWAEESGVRFDAGAGEALGDPFTVRLPTGVWKMFYRTGPK